MKTEIKKQYTYIVCAEHKFTGKVINTSKLMTGEQVEKEFGVVCLDLYFNTEPDYPFSDIDFKIMRVENNINENADTQLINLFDNSLLILVNNLEQTAEYNDAQLILIHNAFSKIKFMFSKFMFVNEFVTEMKLNGLVNKVVTEFQLLNFFQEEEIILLVDWIKSLLQHIQEICLVEEKYEISANIKRYLSANNIYTITNEKI